MLESPERMHSRCKQEHYLPLDKQFKVKEKKPGGGGGKKWDPGGKRRSKFIAEGKRRTTGKICRPGEKS